MKLSMWLLVVSLIVLNMVVSAQAAIILSTDANVSEDFDGIGTDHVVQLPDGWRIDGFTGASGFRRLGTYGAASTSTTRRGGANLT